MTRNYRRHQQPRVRLAFEGLLPTWDAYGHNLLVGTTLSRSATDEGERAIFKFTLFQRLLRDVAPADAPEAERLELGLARLLREAEGRPRPIPAAASHIEGNRGVLARALELDRTESELLKFLLATATSRPLYEVLDSYGPITTEAAAGTVAAAIGERPDLVRKALGQGGRLVRAGLLRVNPALAPFDDKVRLDPSLLNLMFDGRLTKKTLLATFVPLSRPAQRVLEDFSHLGPGLDQVLRLVKGALEARALGMNVLLYGPTGCGKTELARVLAAALGVDLHEAGATREPDDSLQSMDRLTAISAGARLLGEGRALMLFDELEDLFDTSGPPWARAQARMTKVWFNRFLETNPVPTLWTTNDVSRIDPAFLRRFAFALELPALGEPQRLAVWAQHKKEGDALAPEDLEALARGFEVSPATIALAAKTCRLSSGGVVRRGEIERVLRATLRVMGRRELRAGVGGRYDVSAVNASVDAASLADRLASWTPERGPLTLCLHGPPGTGKSEYVRYLAHRLGRPLRVFGASDILSKWVGESERTLATAFRDAEREGAVLVFDEVDSFLRDRREATHRFEANLTNEFLQRLEEHQGIVAGTTNLLDELDPAVLRRFAIKVEFRALSDDQARRLFGRYFGSQALEAPLAGALPDGLTPGDFAAVARRLVLEGTTPCVADVVALLRGEVVTRERDIATTPMGFRT